MDAEQAAIEVVEITVLSTAKEQHRSTALVIHAKHAKTIVRVARVNVVVLAREVAR